MLVPSAPWLLHSLRSSLVVEAEVQNPRSLHAAISRSSGAYCTTGHFQC